MRPALAVGAAPVMPERSRIRTIQSCTTPLEPWELGSAAAANEQPLAVAVDHGGGLRAPGR